MKKQLLLSLCISIIIVFICKSQNSNIQNGADQTYKFSNEFNSLLSPTGLNIKQGTTDYLDESNYTFQNTKKDSTRDVQFEIQNVSPELISIQSSVVTGTGFSRIGTIPTILNPNDKATFKIRFSPTEIKNYTGKILITSSYSTDQFYQLNFAGDGTAVGIAKATINSFYNISPNPASELTNVKLNIADKSNVTFELFNISGQNVFSKTVSNSHSSFVLQRNNLPAGIYQFIIFDDQNGLISKGKLIFK
jgi:hypothetical protein